MGLWIAWQLNAVDQANLAYNRESRLSIFKEIQIVKKSNQTLNETVVDLERELANSNDKAKALENLKNDIKKNQIIAGEVAVQGAGVEVRIEQNVAALWFTDAVNDLFTAGAEVISINGIRYAGDFQGFDKMPNGKILFGSEILTEPYIIQAIGDQAVLMDSLEQKGGFLDRITLSIPGVKVSGKKVDEIKINSLPLAY